MRYRKLSSDDDYTFGASQLNFYRDVPEAVGQSVKTRLLLWLGEWYQDIEEGTAYLEGVLGKYSQSTADSTIQDRVLTTDGMVSIDNYESAVNPDTRSMSVTSDLNTIYGPTQLQIENYTKF